MNWLKRIAIGLPNPLDQEKHKWDIIGLIRGHLEGTMRRTTTELMYSLVNNVILVGEDDFNQIVEEMFERGFLEDAGEGSFSWAQDSPSFPGNLSL